MIWKKPNKKTRSISFRFTGRHYRASSTFWKTLAWSANWHNTFRQFARVHTYIYTHTHTHNNYRRREVAVACLSDFFLSVFFVFLLFDFFRSFYTPSWFFPWLYICVPLSNCYNIISTVHEVVHCSAVFFCCGFSVLRTPWCTLFYSHGNRCSETSTIYIRQLYYYNTPTCTCGYGIPKLELGVIELCTGYAVYGR